MKVTGWQRSLSITPLQASVVFSPSTDVRVTDLTQEHAVHVGNAVEDVITFDLMHDGLSKVSVSRRTQTHHSKPATTV